MNLKQLIQLILNEEDNRFSYLLNILTVINKKEKFTPQEISNINKRIIDSQKNKFDYFEGKTIKQFKKEVINGSIELIEKGSSTGKKLPVEKQHIIISFLEDYIKQVQLERIKGKLFYKI